MANNAVLLSIPYGLLVLFDETRSPPEAYLLDAERFPCAEKIVWMRYAADHSEFNVCCLLYGGEPCLRL